MITHYRYIRVMERYTATLHVKKMVGLVAVKFIMLLTFELSSFLRKRLFSFTAFSTL